jgi:rhodanese-related sulfurtransferase
MARKAAEPTTVSPEDARELVASDEALVIDIRDEEEFGSGHIAGATRIEEEDLESRLEELGEVERIIVVCAKGERSAKVAESLRERGYEAANMKGGMEAWDGPLQPAESDFEFEGPGDTQPGV